LVDLLAWLAPWALLLGVTIYLCPFILTEWSEEQTWRMLFFPISSPALAIGSTIDWPPRTGTVVLNSAIFAGHLGLVVFLQYRFYCWLKYLVPAHLLVVSAIPVGKDIGVLLSVYSLF